ncbi:hypothetical protein T484DRAFT_1855511 [Baffinella frigidus]|nr:hypothetical protein T484DRAFT_1855511 [Cryptophyta sp. CCMP2293]
MRSVGLNMPMGLTPQHGSSGSTPRTSTPRAPAKAGAAPRDEAGSRGDDPGVGILLNSTETPVGAGAGLVVRHVWPGSPADSAGILPGDILLTVDGGHVLDPELAAAALRGPASSTVAVTLRREGAGGIEIPALERAPPLAVRALDDALDRLQKLAGEGRGSPGGIAPEALAEAVGACARARAQMVEDRKRLLDDIGGAARREVKAWDAAARRDAVLVEIAVGGENPRGDPQVNP